MGELIPKSEIDTRDHGSVHLTDKQLREASSETIKTTERAIYEFIRQNPTIEVVTERNPAIGGITIHWRKHRA